MPPLLETIMLPSIEQCLAQARLEVLSDVEREERETIDATKPLNPRNEAAALSLLYAPRRLEQTLGGGGGGGDAERRREQLDALAATYVERTSGGRPEAPSTTTISQEPVDASTVALAAWALGQQQEAAAAADGQPASAAVAPAIFCDSASNSRRRRGLVATRDLLPGDVALALPLCPPASPAGLAITYATAKDSDLGAALKGLGLDDESLALVWTMADRRDADSPHAPFWAALPQDDARGFGTPLGAGVGDAALKEALEGTPLFQRAEHARAHLASAYASLLPAVTALVRAYPQHLEAAWFSRNSFLWASELWYGYAMQLALPPAAAARAGAPAQPPRVPEPVPALVPLASLANHSAWPHAVAYSDCTGGGGGGGDGQAGSGGGGAGWQRLRVFRPARAGEELFISYGAHANDELLLFYGFALDPNPHDAREVRRQLRAAAAKGGGEAGGAAAAAAAGWRDAHAAALARVERALESEGKWTATELEFFGQALVFLRGFLRELKTVVEGGGGGGGNSASVGN